MTVSAATSATNTSAGTAANAVNNAEIASNFTQFLQLLTTQLKNQDPLSPMDTNQFTQQLVMFAQVEQQMSTNNSLSTLVTLQQSAQATQALALVGATVIVNGSTATLANGQAGWTLNTAKPAAATVTITDSTGRTAYTGKFTVNAGAQNFVWDGRGNDGTLWPDGNYKLTATGTDANGQSTAISTQVEAKVSAVDLTQSPPELTINGQTYTVNQLQQIVATN